MTGDPPAVIDAADPGDPGEAGDPIAVAFGAGLAGMPPGRLDVLTVGEAMVAFRSEGLLAQGSRWVVRLAGAESNVAIGLARLGHRVGWVGRVGADRFGDLVVRTLRGEGVETAHAVVDPERPTGLMFVEQRSADLARVDYRRAGSAGSALHADDLVAALAARPRVLHLTGITPALSDSAREAVSDTVVAARRDGILVCLDVNFRSQLWSRERASAVLAPLAGRVDVVVAGDDELGLVRPGTPADVADVADLTDVADAREEAAIVSALLSGGVRQVAVKRGARGASLFTGDGRVDAPALAVTAVDPIGAGDAFTAGLLSGLLDGLPPGECLARAAVTGAFAVSSHGDWEGAPTRAELSLLAGQARGGTLR